MTNNIQHIDSVVQVLKVVKLTLQVLSRRDSNLLRVEATLKFMLKKLKAQKTDLGIDLDNAMSTRTCRRRSMLSGIMLHLQNAQVT